MAGRDNGGGGIGSNGHGPSDGRGFDDLDSLSEEDLELLVGSVEDEEEVRALLDEAEPEEPGIEQSAAPVEAAAESRQRPQDDDREPVALRLFPEWEYDAGANEPRGANDVDAANGPGNGFGGDGARTGIARARHLLAPVEAALRSADLYAYGTLDDQNRWTIAVDDEAGRVDVRVEPEGFVLDLRATSPGLYADIEHPFRRRRMERSIRDALPRVARGALAPHQTAGWDEVDQGVAVGIRYLVPFARAAEIGRIVRQRLPELDDLLTLVEQRVTE